MNLLNLRDIFEKIPYIPLMFAYLAYLGYDYYNFTADQFSALNQVKQQTVVAQTDVDALNAKIKKMNDFAQVLSLKKSELRSLAQELESNKASLPESFDIPELMRTLIVEAKRAGLTVLSLKPGEEKSSEFYSEKIFQFSSTGIYFQYVAFLDRVSNLQKIIMVDNVDFSPVSAASAKYVQLKSTIEFRAFRYVSSKEDELGKDRGTPKPASAGKGT